MLDNTSRIAWYALASLVGQINNGSVNMYGSFGNRVATLADAKNFIKSICLVSGLFTATPAKTMNPPLPIPKPPIVITNTETLRAKLAEVLKSSPMKILSAEKAIALIAGKGLTVSRSDLLAFVNVSKDSFRIYPSKSGSDVMIGLTGKA